MLSFAPSKQGVMVGLYLRVVTDEISARVVDVIVSRESRALSTRTRRQPWPDVD